MMFKIIKVEGCKTSNEVLVFIDRGSDKDCVVVMAWHNTENGYLIQEQYLSAAEDNMNTLKGIVRDFSEDSARTFLNEMEF